MGTFDVAARHGGDPGGQGHHSELVQRSAACNSDKYGHETPGSNREEREGERRGVAKWH